MDTAPPDSAAIDSATHWSQVAANPNAAAALEYRAQRVLAARRDPVPSRTEYLMDLVRGKRVLDVGIVDHTLDRGLTLHRAVSKTAAYCLGVDILEKEVEAMRREGFNVRVFDITRDTLDEKFDVVLVGEVIEHLGNPTAMIESAARLLAPAGRLVMTTPNPFYLARIRDALFGRVKESADHVSMLFPSGIAELAERAGLRLSDYRGVAVHTAKTLRGKLALSLRKIARLAGIVPECFCDTIIYECTSP